MTNKRTDNHKIQKNESQNNSISIDRGAHFSCTNLNEDLYDRVEDGNFGQTPSEVQAGCWAALILH
ncbi:hypothetical protein [Flavobacterium sp. 3HN19-14]|uniref:hypothetical protein n=1 Tax=Flavobacterium sp. 3HN19-14 TaxID=3448133 RepID=UPI003EE14B5D